MEDKEPKTMQGPTMDEINEALARLADEFRLAGLTVTVTPLTKPVSPKLYWSDATGWVTIPESER